MLPHTFVLRARVPLSQQVRSSLEHLYTTCSASEVFSTEHVFSRDTREKCVERLRKTKSFRPPTDENAKQAAVLVPLCVVNGQVSLLYTLRSPFMSTHRGQVSFPGGMRDITDPTFEATAVRETKEELGIACDNVDIWGACNPMAARNGTTVVPVVGSLGTINVEALNANPQEVGDVFCIPLHRLCEEKNFRYTQFRNGYVIPVYLGGKHRVWGLTAVITHFVLSALLPSVYNNNVYFIRPIKSQIKPA